MKTLQALTVLVGGLAAIAPCAFAQKFEVVTGKAFDSAVPKDFYLEGNAIPTQKRNAVLVKTAAGSRAVFALIDTAGYSADIINKYIGMIITEGDLTICGKKIGTGSYGFGWTRPGTGVEGPGKISIYDQAGASLTSCETPRDAALKQPRPLQVVVQDRAARLYYGRHFVEVH
jgi:hypothetical protein